MYRYIYNCNIEWKFQQPDWFDKQQRIIENFNNSMKIWDNLDASFSYMQKLENITANITSLQPLFSELVLPDDKSGVLKSMENMQKLLADIQLPKAFDLLPSLEKIMPVLDFTREIPTVDWDWVNDNINSCESYDEETIEEILTNEVSEEINESVQETISSNEEIQKNIEERYAEWKDKHPLLADLFLQLVSVIFSMILSSILKWVLGIFVNPANVYEEPKSSSPVLISVNNNQYVNIVNKVPYYYKVVFTDPETGEEITGYVYKPNIEILSKKIRK